MSSTDAEWREWIEKQITEEAWNAKCHQMAEQLQREHLARKDRQPPAALSRADQLVELRCHAVRKLLQEIAKETVAHKSAARLRLYRLADFIEQWRSYGHLPDGHPDLLQDVVCEFVALLEHMGVEWSWPQAGGAT